MVTEGKTFKTDLNELRKFLASKRKLSDLARELGVCRKTVDNAFSVKDESELTGKKINVYRRALEIRQEIESIINS